VGSVWVFFSFGVRVLLNYASLSAPGFVVGQVSHFLVC